MQKELFRIANEKFNELRIRYNGFLNVVLDNWRGFRFIYDTKDVRNCTNNCDECALFCLLKNEPSDANGEFVAGLKEATEKEKNIFGPQRFLNCKSLVQYQWCFINFLTMEAKTRSAIEEEIDLIFEVKIIYSTECDDVSELQNSFARFIIEQAISRIDSERRGIITRYVSIRYGA